MLDAKEKVFQSIEEEELLGLLMEDALRCKDEKTLPLIGMSFKRIKTFMLCCLVSNTYLLQHEL